MDELKTLIEPISRHVAGLDLSRTADAEASMNTRFPPGSAALRSLTAAARAACTAGQICHRGEPKMRFSRVVKPEQDAAGCAVDAVYMDRSAGPPHTHPNGEVCLCLPDAPGATFEDRTDTWVILPPGSRHVPEVKHGAMLILYWLPGGAVQWG